MHKTWSGEPREKGDEEDRVRGIVIGTGTVVIFFSTLERQGRVAACGELT
jgi:hypothetical protein